MIIEGIGRVAPTPKRVSLSNCDLIYCREISDSRNKHRGYKSSESQWKNGICDDPVFIGTVGELALQKYLACNGLNCRIVNEDLNNGDFGIDFVWCGCKYQVKTVLNIDRENILVRRSKTNRTIDSHSASRFVFCQFSGKDKTAAILGWCNRETVVNSKYEKSPIRDAGWFNNVIDRRSLLPIADLLRLMRQEANNV
jgi:hypothetical protein